MMKKILLYFFYFFSSITLFAFDYLPKIFIGQIEVSLGMSRKEIVSFFGEPDSYKIDTESVNEEYTSVRMDYSKKELLFYYNKGDEKIHTIKAQNDFSLFLDNGCIISSNTSIQELQQLFPKIYKISDISYVVSFDNKDRTIITDDIYFYFDLDRKLERIIITNDYY